MKYYSHFLFVFFIHLFCTTALAQHDVESEQLFSKAVSQLKKGKREKAERNFQRVLILDPDNYVAHDYIRGIYHQGYTSIPLMACYKIALIGYTDTVNDNNIYKAIDYYAHRFITRTDSGNTCHVAPYFVKRFDSSLENNVSVMELAFITSGGIDLSEQNHTLNEAEKLEKKFRFIFENNDKWRAKNYGFYWDYYIDYFADLTKSPHVKTACHLIYYRKGDAEIKKWIDNNPEKVAAFKEWDSKEMKAIMQKKYEY